MTPLLLALALTAVFCAVLLKALAWAAVFLVLSLAATAAWLWPQRPKEPA
jgi:hypothetical protein